MDFNKHNKEREERFDSYAKLFAARFNEIMLKKKINAYQLGAELSITPMTIYKYQRGETCPNNILEKLIAYVLEVDPRYFYDPRITFEEATRLFKEKPFDHSHNKHNSVSIKHKSEPEPEPEESSTKKKAHAIISKLPDEEVKKIIKIIKIVMPDTD